jgi:chromosome segregation ATPase
MQLNDIFTRVVFSILTRCDIHRLYVKDKVSSHRHKRRNTIERELILSIEFLSDLENKVDAIIGNYEQLRQENIALKSALDAKAAALAELEGENLLLKNNLSELQADSQRHQDKLKAAAEKVQGLIAKIEGV